ncbi:hypothetical protein HRG_005412 [Hirsutella rhossiliensis]|uniref:Uncharacterized protein n=1 Tax=Hirsutella rhossiliensis TaxID=111463 RepID=A0A9P8MXQ0_9HYPO|nr:uncharacterized protein HRG_05412 [Hirsutella rhossiliensis]KAH0962902.1 hypothetical protein HRG_05412 [Hirsutella rhossiliensis]
MSIKLHKPDEVEVLSTKDTKLMEQLFPDMEPNPDGLNGGKPPIDFDKEFNKLATTLREGEPSVSRQIQALTDEQAGLGPFPAFRMLTRPFMTRLAGHRRGCLAPRQVLLRGG